MLKKNYKKLRKKFKIEISVLFVAIALLSYALWTLVLGRSRYL